MAEIVVNDISVIMLFMFSVILDKSLTYTYPITMRSEDGYFTKVDVLDDAMPKRTIMAWLKENCSGRYFIRVVRQKNQVQDERLEILFHDDHDALHFKMMWGGGMDEDNEPS